MIPKHVSDKLKTLSAAQQAKFQELMMWSGNSGMKGSTLPVNYDGILDMVIRMGEEPVTPVDPPPVIEEPVFKKAKT